MGNRSLAVVVGIMVAVLLPVAAEAGADDPGACLVTLEEQPKAPEGGEVAYVCTNELTEGQCNSFCGGSNRFEGGLFVVGCEFFNFATCEDVAEKGDWDWDGACELSGKGFPNGQICTEIVEFLPGWTSETVCESGKGDWQGDGSTCGAPVPALPKAGQAALVLVLMLGALVILNMSGMLRAN